MSVPKIRWEDFVEGSVAEFDPQPHHPDEEAGVRFSSSFGWTERRIIRMLRIAPLRIASRRSQAAMPASPRAARATAQ
jgi:hypothetical protein